MSSQKILFTGSSGFLGRNVIPILKKRYDVDTLDIVGKPDYICNLGSDTPVIKTFYDIIIHAAGKAHTIPRDRKEEEEYYVSNYLGTCNLCSALEKYALPKAFLYISTVAVYGCKEGVLLEESLPLKGETAYAKSKIEAENYLIQWCKKYSIKLTILRPSLLAGPNPPGNLGAMINGINNRRYLSVGGGKARRSILMVEDIAYVVPAAAKIGGIYNICDDSNPTIREIEKIISSQLGLNMPMIIPDIILKWIAKLGDKMHGKAIFDSIKYDKLTSTLTFSNALIKEKLDFKPSNVIKNFTIK